MDPFGLILIDKASYSFECKNIFWVNISFPLEFILFLFVFVAGSVGMFD